MFFRTNVFAFVATYYFLFVKGQTTHPVMVGFQGSFYNPPTISANINDTVVFSFLGDVHTVTQSSFDNPCLPLAGGFNSGPAGTGANNTAPVPTWNLVITNVSAPIWFFCIATQPTSHCAAGMVGVINPPNISMYQTFLAAAKQVTGTPVPSATILLSGQGAFATNSPSADLVTASNTAPAASPTSSTSSMSMITPTSTSTSSSTPSATSAVVSSAKSHVGAIVGGTVGGAMAIIGFIVVGWLFLQRRKKTPLTPESDEFFRYDHTPGRGASQTFWEPKDQSEGPNPNGPAITNIHEDVVPTARFNPVRRPTPHNGQVVLESHHHLHRQISELSDPSTSASGRAPSNTVDIRSLAQEVAAVLYQSPLLPNRQVLLKNPSQDMRSPQTMMLHTLSSDDVEDGAVSQSGHQPPPNYRAATGPSSSSHVRGKET